MHPHLGGDRGVRGALGGSEHDPRADHVAMRRASTTERGPQNGLVEGGQGDDERAAHGHRSVVLRPGLTRRDTPCHQHRSRELGHDRQMAKIPDSTKASLHQRLTERSRQRWPRSARSACATAPASPTSTASWPTGRSCGCAGCATPARPETGASRSTEPATTTTKTPTYPPASWAAPPKTPSTPPAASTSPTPPPGPEPPTNLRP